LNTLYISDHSVPEHSWISLKSGGTLQKKDHPQQQSTAFSEESVPGNKKAELAG